MYHYIDDKSLLASLKCYGREKMQNLCHTLKEEYNIGAKFHLVGSGSENLIMRNGANPIDLDYNLEIVRCEDFDDCRFLKECTRKALNPLQFWAADCKDSKSVLTTPIIYLPLGNPFPIPTCFSLDICIISKDQKGNYYRLIHEKTGWADKDRYYWNIAKNFSEVEKRAAFIKAKGKWHFVREQYKNIKNRYLTQNDYNHPSFICYIEAVNNVYNSRKHW